MLMKLLAEDAVLYSDGGGKRAAALNPICGAEKILRFLAGIARKNPALPGMQCAACHRERPCRFRHARGRWRRSTPWRSSIATGRIVAIYVVRNPEKLRHVRF